MPPIAELRLDSKVVNRLHQDAEIVEIGRGLSYLFFQLDMWDQPLDVARDLRKHLRHHSVHYVTTQHRSGSKARYNLDALLTEFKRIAANALYQIYYNVDDHAREVWQYVERGMN